MSNKSKSQNVVIWRKNMKARLIEAMGGSCLCCGYKKCNDALAFHHIDPSNKKFSLGQFNTASWERVIQEVRKCILVCHNCHGEIHYGLRQLPVNLVRFNEEYANYKEKNRKLNEAAKIKSKCIVCQKIVKIEQNKYCSHECAQKASRKVKRPYKEELLEHLQTMSFVAIGKKYGVSDNAVRKWLKAYNSH